ncbi:8-oxo-dGTP diphosphatase MutT [Thalassotalea mangrovi]|uniref:8-oxo-dGTP diphosphatase n=1 Tax=Thalassotalea mangrovi TaxID=2572245 RepID=A0A4U1BAW7_9GAMM|nr:8-oxo-dGTP diphosphatase MutT [Thalassotalea mangrovi]TKB47685.1 8-oxo-dGTP diphosphatase MutT [Thalassotalea mangrovi]
MNKRLHVAVGVIYRDGQVFLTRRHQHQHQGGRWEFPGGKVEANETVHQALHRELMEEVAIDVLAMRPLLNISHDYDDKSVLLEVFIVDQFGGEPESQEGMEQGWFALAQLASLEFPEANQRIIDKLLQQAAY